MLPEGADPAGYTSAERIFDEKLPIYPNVAWTYSLRPDDVRLPDAPIVHPLPADAGGELPDPVARVVGRR